MGVLGRWELAGLVKVEDGGSGCVGEVGPGRFVQGGGRVCVWRLVGLVLVEDGGSECVGSW